MSSDAQVFLVVSQLAAGAVADDYYTGLRRKSGGALLPEFENGLWMIGPQSGFEDPRLLRHWAVRIRGKYHELGRAESGNGIRLEVNSISEPAREITQTDLLGYTHCGEDEIYQFGMPTRLIHN